MQPIMGALNRGLTEVAINARVILSFNYNVQLGASTSRDSHVAYTIWELGLAKPNGNM